ncbi:peptidoglycan/LPS O-acetylase OafA/YrhL [Hydrogenophaga palleronii]|uniref:Peptidoglycan/LPS O-acetylase OafA/YrhL n=1 Tax=Hydrogenophaga palleronii TaxID=65655 RepID=A0ABU1WSP6_9BURK|nr:acyltransferase family protein [Hydrogenophaga palleronii]MDR7152062.1 peptidoglycan/LPS O-acetylase OafA/YrhL [Hydrogenophaga palleronii]
MNRRHDIDALRALAFAIVITYHVGMYYVADWHWHLKSPHAAEWLQWPMRALNLWRMDLVFLISGVAFGFLSRGLTPARLIGARSLRLLLPLAFGMAVVVPYQPYVQAIEQGVIEPGFAAFLARYFTGGQWPRGAFDGSDFGVTWNHLWYLPYLWLYTVVLALLSPALASNAGQRWRQSVTRLRGAALLVLPAMPLVLYSLVLWPRFPPSHDLIHDAWLHAVYFTLFLYGHWLGVDADLWAELRRLRWTALALAVCAFALHVGLRLTLAGTDPVWRMLARWVADAYVWASLVAVLGWGHHALDRPWPWLAWANESVYPWYVLHQTLVIVLAVWLAPLALGPVVEPIVLLLGTVLGCWFLTDGLVRRVGWLRPLFGLKRQVGEAAGCTDQRGDGSLVPDRAGAVGRLKP